MTQRAWSVDLTIDIVRTKSAKNIALDTLRVQTVIDSADTASDALNDAFEEVVNTYGLLKGDLNITHIDIIPSEERT